MQPSIEQINKTLSDEQRIQITNTDDKKNQYVWFTSSYPDLEVDESYNARFIVKENQESDQYGKQNMIKNFKVAQ